MVDFNNINPIFKHKENVKVMDTMCNELKASYVRPGDIGKIVRIEINRKDIFYLVEFGINNKYRKFFPQEALGKIL